MSILHIDSSARIEGSNSRTISRYIAEKLGGERVYRDLGQNPLPEIEAADLVGVHASSDAQRQSLQDQLELSDQLIEELRQASTLILGVPMYNFTIPANLKRWVDAICRAGVSFRYTEQGPVGLLGVKRAFIVTATGGTPVGSEMDFASRYLELICRFIGVEDVIHIDASGSKGSPELVLQQARQQVDELLLDAAVS